MKFSCPGCGADNHKEKFDVYLNCEHCSTSLFVDVDGVFPVFAVKAEIESKDLKNHLELGFGKTGFPEEVEITDITPLYLPFWKIENKNNLKNGSTQFPEDIIKFSPENTTCLNIFELRGHVKIVDIGTQPSVSDKRILYYFPFFKVKVLFREEEFRFFINAVNGEVYGNPIPYIPTDKVFRLFPLFIFAFIIFITFSLLFDHVLVTLSSSFIALYILSMVAVQWIDPKETNK